MKTIRDMRVAAGYASQKKLLAAIGVSTKNAGFGVALDKGRVPTNHPLVPKIAKALRQPESKIRSLLTGKPIDEKQSRAALTGRRARRMTRGSVIDLRRNERPQRNSLKRLPHNVRQAARTLVGTVNTNIVAGRAYLEVVPVKDLVPVLEDYFRLRGIKKTLLLSPEYAEAFG